MRYLLSGIRSWCAALGLLFLVGCTTPGPVTPQINTKKNPVVSAPFEFQSPMTAIQNFAEARREVSKETANFSNGALKALLAQQEKIKNELFESGKLRLEPGHSYEFTLESFCVNAGIERPVVGDGLYIGNLEGSPQKWLPQILSKHKKSGLNQDETQILIWSLLSGARFNELSSQNQQNLLKIFPDAAVRFGHSMIESKAQDFVWSQVPSELIDAKNKWDNFQNLLQDTQVTFQEVENVLSPQPKRTDPLPIGWIKTEEGYLINLTSRGYKQVQVKIYAPEKLSPDVYFDPTKKIALPGVGQRLALSNQVLDDVNKILGNVASDYVKKKNKQQLTETEKNLVVKYPYDAVKIGDAMSEAYLKTNSIFGSSPKHNTSADAFRHFLWSGLSANKVGPGLATKFLEAHEDFSTNPPQEKSMDLHNNKQGIDYFKNYNGNSFEEDLVKEGLLKIKNGELKWLI